MFVMIESYLIALIDDYYECQSNPSKRNQPGRFDDFDEFFAISVTACTSRYIFNDEVRKQEITARLQIMNI